MLIHAADIAMEIKEAHRFSIKTSFGGVDSKELVTRVENTIDHDSNSINPIYEKQRPRREVRNSNQLSLFFFCASCLFVRFAWECG